MGQENMEGQCAMKRILITGSAGFLASNLIPILKEQKYEVVGIDKTPSENSDYVLNLTDREKCFALLEHVQPKIVIHLAAQIDFNERTAGALYANNFEATKNLKDAALRTGVEQIIFTSSCSIFAGSTEEKFNELSPPRPIDEYGQSKVAEEAYLLKATESSMAVNILRTPMIVGTGRLGMLSILFELIDRGNAVWVLGDGGVRHQLVYVGDVCSAIDGLLKQEKGGIYHVGSQHVPTFREMYERLISLVGSRSKVRSIPKRPAIWALGIARHLKISPMGGYQLRMLTTNFSFDYDNICRKISWQPTKTNVEMLYEAYKSYKRSVHNTSNAEEKISKNRMGAKFGILKILKYIY